MAAIPVPIHSFRHEDPTGMFMRLWLDEQHAYYQLVTTTTRCRGSGPEIGVEKYNRWVDRHFPFFPKSSRLYRVAPIREKKVRHYYSPS